MFPALTASSITLTPPLEDSHTLDIIASAWGWEGGEEGGVGWVDGVGEEVDGGGVVREMGVSARVSGRFLKRRRLPSSGPAWATQARALQRPETSR